MDAEHVRGNVVVEHPGMVQVGPDRVVVDAVGVAVDDVPVEEVQQDLNAVISNTGRM
jgi:hypothetical protein